MDVAAIRAKVAPIFSGCPGAVLAYLFGSVARGETHSRSDLDFAVLLDDPDLGVFRTLWSDLHAVLRPQRFDLVTLNGADPVLCFEVISAGILIVSRSDDELNAFERRAWHRYQDTRHLRAIGNSYLRARGRAWFSKKRSSGSV